MNKLKGTLALLFASIIWGSTFVAQSAGMDSMGPYTYNAARFAVGFLVLMPVALWSLKEKKGKVENYEQYVRNSIIGGIIVGIPEGIASTFQQLGIMGSTTGKAGFITALYIVMVPLVSALFGKKITKNVFIAVSIAVVGFYLLSMSESFSLSIYDLYLLLCAFTFTIQILFVDHYSKIADAIVLSMMQFVVSTVISLLLMVIFKETPTFSQFQAAAIPILYAGVLSCGLAYTLQIVGQQNLDSTVASLLMSLESVFSAIFGFLILHDTLTVKELFGCVLIFIAVILSQLPQKEEKSI